LQRLTGIIGDGGATGGPVRAPDGWRI